MFVKQLRGSRWASKAAAKDASTSVCSSVPSIPTSKLSCWYMCKETTLAHLQGGRVCRYTGERLVSML